MVLGSLSLARVLGVLSIFIVALGASPAFAADSETLASVPTYDRPAVEIGGGISNDGGSGDINFLAPLVFSDGKDLLFFGADVKFSGFDVNDTDDTVYNVGAYLGYRSTFEGGGVFGLWAGVDYFNTDHSNEFARAIAGVEYYGSSVIARANAFVPLDSTSAEWSVTSAGFITTYDEKIPSGFDAELGLRMPVAMNSFVKPGEFRIFAGAYDFIGLADDGGDVFGGRARAELDLYLFDESPDTRLSLIGSYANDKHSGDQYAAGIKLSIPLGITNKITEHGAKDTAVAELDSFGQDLFQPVRRNQSNVSRIRLKDRRAVPVVNPGTGGTAGVTLSNVCGGTNGSIALNSGLGATSIKQGAQIGIIDPSGSATALNLTLATMVAANGQTLTQLLASSPATINTTLSFPGVNFATQTVQPSTIVAASSSPATEQKITSATVIINGNSCSMNVETTSTVFTLANVCGGPGKPISITSSYPGIQLSVSSVLQGGSLGDVKMFDGTIVRPVSLSIGDMVDGSGQTLTQLLASKPTTINTTVSWSASIFDPNAEYVDPTSAYVVTDSALEG